MKPHIKLTRCGWLCQSVQRPLQRTPNGRLFYPAEELPMEGWGDTPNRAYMFWLAGKLQVK